MISHSLTRQFVSDLHRLGLREGDVLMVHASLKSLGRPEMAPSDVVEALLATVSPGGTLLMPALSYKQQPPEVHRTAETPGNVGALSECFRRMPGTIRSVHPTHSVCGAGPAVAELLGRHREDATPCGPNSPFRRILDLDARIVMLGCGLRPNTTMHAVEELAEAPYLFGEDRDYDITTVAGERYVKRYRTHGFAGWLQRYDRIAQLGVADLYRVGRVLNAETHVINTRRLKAAALAKLREDPWYFVERRQT
jgi:aminoglycoside 3-N-acetyltransferase